MASIPANATCLLSLDGNDQTVTTDGTGRIDQDLPTTKSGFLVIQDDQTRSRTSRFHCWSAT